MCWEISSTAAASRAGSSDMPAMRRRICCVQSCMLGLRDPLHRLDEGGPGAAPLAQRLPAVGGEPVVAAASLRRPLDPAALDQSLCFEPVEQGIQRGDVEAQRAAGASVDELADLVAVPGALLDEGEDEQLRGALLQLAIEVSCHHMCDHNIWYARRARRFRVESPPARDS